MKPTIHLSQFIAILFALTLNTSLLAQELAPASPESVGMSSKRLERLTHTFQDYIDEGALPGVVILVARKGEIAYYEALGKSDLEQNKAMKKDAIFRIASQTKAIVSVGVMMLQEEGKLLISDPVSKYLPAFEKTTVAVPRDDGEYDIVKANRPITIRDLLSHNAGIGYGYGIASDLWEAAGIKGWYFADRDEPIQATVNRMASLPFAAQPGERFEYGYNTDILGALIEVVSGQPLDQFLQKRIFDPLGMNDTHFYLPKEKVNRLTTVYSATNEGLKLAPNPGDGIGQGAYVDGPRKSFSGGAGLLSTALDYAKFLQMMLNNGTYNDHRIISRKTVEVMTSVYISNEMFPWVKGTGFGLGFSVIMDVGQRNEPCSVGEYGWGGAYHSTYWVNPEEELVVVYFTQIIPDNGLQDHAKLRVGVYQGLE